MRRLLASMVVVVLMAAPALAIDTAPAFDDPALQSRYERLTRELRCLVCQNQSIADSNAFLAKDLRREVKEMIGDGASDKEIVDFMVARYGDFVLYRPRLSGRTWLLWAAPGILLLVGLGVIVLVIVRKSKLPLDDDLTDEEVSEDQIGEGQIGENDSGETGGLRP